MRLVDFAVFGLREIVRGGRSYYAWLGFLAVLILVGIFTMRYVLVIGGQLINSTGH